jgi:uncharacterized membrane protein
MFWYGAGLGPWFLFPMLMCFAMMAIMMLFMSHGHMGRSGHTDEPPSDPALDTLRQRFASGELTQQEFVERRQQLLSV